MKTITKSQYPNYPDTEDCPFKSHCSSEGTMCRTCKHNPNAKENHYAPKNKGWYSEERGRPTKQYTAKK